jgi:hypothetical protein
MVTGFNTDVKHDGKVYHVQTEDKGLQNPIIETLIYMGGEILAARRSSYADLMERGPSEQEIAERIEAQHNRMILDIRDGRYDRKRHRPFGEGIISGKSFDEVVLEWLAGTTGKERITLQMVDSTGFVEGDEARMELLVSRANDGEGLAGAQVRVKMISTVGKPKTLAEGETDAEGLVRLSCRLPTLADGSGALIIQTTAGSETAEIKQVLKKPPRKAAG